MKGPGDSLGFSLMIKQLMKKNLKKTYIGILIFAFILAIGIYLHDGIRLDQSFVSPTPGQTTSIESISFPKGGEILKQGNAYLLKWTDADTSTTTTQIFLIDTALEAEGASASISDRVYAVPDTGSYQYVIPESLPDGIYKFEIGTLLSLPFTVSSK